MNKRRIGMFDDDHKPADNRTVNDTKQELQAGVGHVRNLGSGRSHVTIIWDFNQQAKDQGVVIMKVGKEEVIVSAEQMMRYLRWA